MSENRILVYNFKEHGLYYKNDSQNISQKIIMTIFTVQLEFDYNMGNLLSIIGYLPLIKAIKKHIDIPYYIEKVFCIPIHHKHKCRSNNSYGFKRYFIKSKWNWGD